MYNIFYPPLSEKIYYPTVIETANLLTNTLLFSATTLFLIIFVTGFIKISLLVLEFVEISTKNLKRIGLFGDCLAFFSVLSLIYSLSQYNFEKSTIILQAEIKTIAAAVTTSASEAYNVGCKEPRLQEGQIKFSNYSDKLCRYIADISKDQERDSFAGVYFALKERRPSHQSDDSLMAFDKLTNSLANYEITADKLARKTSYTPKEVYFDNSKVLLALLIMASFTKIFKSMYELAGESNYKKLRKENEGK